MRQESILFVSPAAQIEVLIQMFLSLQIVTERKSLLIGCTDDAIVHIRCSSLTVFVSDVLVQVCLWITRVLS